MGLASLIKKRSRTCRKEAILFR